MHSSETTAGGGLQATELNVDRVADVLSSHAGVFLAAFEAPCSPTWLNGVGGRANVMDAGRGPIALPPPEKESRLHDRVATLVVRPRGWHLVERHATVGDEPLSASLFDAGLF